MFAKLVWSSNSCCFFILLAQLVTDSKVLKSPVLTVESFIPPFNFVSFCFIYFEGFVQCIQMWYCYKICVYDLMKCILSIALFYLIFIAVFLSPNFFHLHLYFFGIYFLSVNLFWQQRRI